MLKNLVVENLDPDLDPDSYQILYPNHSFEIDSKA